MKKHIYPIVAVVVVAVAVWLSGCGDDCPNCPSCEESPPTDWIAYVTMNSDGPVGVYTIDIASDSITDSILSPGASNIHCSEDGRFISVDLLLEPYGSRVYETSSLGLVGQLSGFGAARFLKGDSLLLRRRSDTLAIHQLRSLALDTFVTLGLTSLNEWYDRTRNRLYVADFPSDSLWRVDVDSLRLERLWRLEGYLLRKFTVHSDGRRAYFLADHATGATFLIYDLEGERIVARQPLYAPFGDLRVHPDGREVWVTDPGTPNSLINPGVIYVFDSENGSLLYTVSLTGYIPGEPLSTLDAWSLEFTPDGRNVIVAIGNLKGQSATLLRISTTSHKVEHIYFPSFNRLPFRIAIGRKPI